MAKMLALDKENERNLAILNRSLNHAFELANRTITTFNEVNRLTKANKETEAICYALTELVSLHELAWKVRGDRESNG